MAQDVSPFVFGNQKPAQAFSTLDASQDNLADGIGSSYGIIGYKGKVWSLRLRGEKYNFVRADDGTPTNHIDVIILRQAHNKSKSYYEKYDPEASEGKRPICSSLDGIVPDADVPVQQSETCALCPRNAWHTNSEGKKTRDCSDYKRLAVLVVPSQTKALLGSPLMEPVFLRVPAASLNDLAVLGETMTGQGWHFSSYVTRISFDPESPHPKMKFTALQALTDKEGPVVLPMRETDMAKRITGEDQVGQPRLAAPKQQPQQIPQQRPAQALAPKQPAMIEMQPSAGGMFEDTGPASDNGKKIAQGGNVAAQVSKAPTQTATDVGETSESEASLDERIASILKTNNLQ